MRIFRSCYGRWLLALGGILLLGLVIGWLQLQRAPKQLRIGVFAGSNWGVPAADSYGIIDMAVQRFEAAHPGVKVTYVSGIPKEDYSEWLAERVVEGNEPDVFLVLPQDFNLYVSMGLLKRLDPLLQQDGDYQPGNYYRAALEYGSHDESQYALPMESVPTLMFVNKTLLQRNGITMPSAEWTWQDFLRICQQLTRDTDGDGAVDQFGCYDYTWQQAALSNGLELFRPDGRTSYFADSRMEEVVRFMIAVQGLNHGYQVSAQDFDMGRVAFRPFTFAEYRTYKPYPWRIKRYSGFEWDCIPMPAGPSGSNASQLDTLMAGMSSRTLQEKLAWEFLKTLCCDKEIQQAIFTKSQGLPVLRQVVTADEVSGPLLQDGQEGMQVNGKMLDRVLEEAVAPPKFAKYGEAMLRADTGMRRILQGNMPFNNALNKLQKEINAYLQY